MKISSQDDTFTIREIPFGAMGGVYEQDDIAASIGWRYIGHQTQPDFEQYSARIKRGGYPVFFGDFQYKFKEQATWYAAVENALAKKIESPLGYRSPGFQLNTGISVTW